jgi:cell division protein ZapB
MSEKPTNDKNGLDGEMRRLEKQVDALLATIGALREENRALRHRQDNLANERASLMQRNEQVRTRVEAMIGRLKTLEHGS